MLINTKTMEEMHNIQYDMLEELIKVMDYLDIKYYFVHGSLLGAIQQHDFILEDDDIDIAIPRRDYNKLMTKGNKYLPEGLFLQNSINDDFPLAFGKMRKTDTAFIQPVLDNYACNKGIYIDIFPIDYSSKYPYITELIIKLMNIRINSRMEGEKRIIYKFIEVISKIIFPSIKKTMRYRESFLSNHSKTEYVSIYGGKKTERGMPIKWFGKGKKVRFRSISVICPDCSKKYLSRIYGKDFMNYNPAVNRISDDFQVEISAKILDFKKSYLDFF